MAIKTEKRACKCSIGDYIEYIEREYDNYGIVRGYVYQANKYDVYIVTDEWDGGKGDIDLFEDAKKKYGKKFSFYINGNYYVKVLRKSTQLNDLSFYIENLWKE